MFKRTTRLLLLLLSLVLLSTALVSAQGAPDQINDALADLNQRLGRAYTLSDINWRWAQETYTDASLGCPVEGQVYAQSQIVAYRFTFIAEGNIYDYRVSADRGILVLCSVTPEDEVPTATPDDTISSGVPDYSNPLCPPPPPGILYMQTRLTPDIQARVIPGLPNNLRDAPNTNAPAVGEIPGGAIFSVVSGPSCDEQGFIWQQVNYDGTVGWTAEGRGGDYFVEPLPGLSVPQSLIPISTQNLVNLEEMSRLQGNLGRSLAFAPITGLDTAAKTLVVTGGLGSEGAWVYDLTQLGLGARTVPGAALLTRVDFGMRSDLALFGGQTGAIRIWDIQAGATLVERAFLQGHDSPVTAVAFSPDGTKLASSGGRAFLRVDATDNMFGIAMWDVDTVTLIDGFRGHTADVLALQFNEAGSVLYSASLDGSIRMWDTATFQQTALAQYPVNDIALSPDGTLLAAGLANGDVALLDAATLEERTTVTAHTASVNSVAFNSDGTLLVSGGDDDNAYVWEVSAALSGDVPVQPQLLTGHFDGVIDVAFSPDDGMIATLSDDNTIRLWGITPTFG